MLVSVWHIGLTAFRVLLDLIRDAAHVVNCRDFQRKCVGTFAVLAMKEDIEKGSILNFIQTSLQGLNSDKRQN